LLMASAKPKTIAFLPAPAIVTRMGRDRVAGSVEAFAASAGRDREWPAERPRRHEIAAF
jgi:hypothetical protein